MLENPLIERKTTIKSNYLGEDIVNLGDKTFTIPEDFNFKVVNISSDYIARMDLVSLIIYGTNKFSDLLCKINGISNPFELNEGTKIVVPNVEDLHKFYYTETTSESDTEMDSEGDTKPKAKAKIDKRKPNEAVVGDKRYKIDSTHKVIIY